MDILLIDLSSLAYPIWHMSQAEPDPNATSIKTVARVRALTDGKPHAAICCDSGRSFRVEIAASYKANRPEQDGTLRHQIRLAQEQLAADGFPVWSSKGFEADDLIAAAAAWAGERQVLIVTADKDLLQLVSPRVRVMSAKDGSVLDEAGVKAKMGVRPYQMRDYLTLVGDASDNIAGVKGIGPKRAAELLAKFGTLADLYQKLEDHGAATIGLTPAIAQELHAFKSSGALATTWALVALRTDVELPFAEIEKPRMPKETETFGADFDVNAEDALVEAVEIPPVVAEPAGNVTPPVQMVVREADVVIEAPAEWERQLDPRSMKDARVLAKDMHDSRMFSAYGTPQGVLSTVMVGRELGLPAMASLRSIHVVEGRHTLSAALMVALVLKSGLAEYFEPVSFSATEATFETKRKGARKAVTLQHTIEMATTAGLVKDKSNWLNVPTDMLVARAQSRLCRMVYPDLMAGLYTPDELAELREGAAA